MGLVVRKMPPGTRREVVEGEEKLHGPFPGTRRPWDTSPPRWRGSARTPSLRLRGCRTAISRAASTSLRPEHAWAACRARSPSCAPGNAAPGSGDTPRPGPTRTPAPRRPPPASPPSRPGPAGSTEPPSNSPSIPGTPLRGPGIACGHARRSPPPRGC